MSSPPKNSTGLPYARRFTELAVYQKARAIACDVFRVTKKLPREEARQIGEQAQEIGRMLGDMMKNAESFCGDDFGFALRETPTFYFTCDVSDDPLNTED